MNNPTTRIYQALIRQRLWRLQKRRAEMHFVRSYKRILQGNCNFVFLYYPHPIPESQYYPFFFYRKEISQEFGVSIQHLNVSDFESVISGTYSRVQNVCVQSWFDIKKSDVDKLFSKIHTTFPNAKVTYFDWFAPSDLRLAHKLDPYIDSYVKKNTFSNLEHYRLAHFGDTNLSDYYGPLYGIDYKRTHYIIPDGFLDKVITGASFITAPYLVSLFNQPFFNANKQLKQIDVHGRLGATGDSWYRKMREDAIRAFSGLGIENSSMSGSVSIRKYLMELSQSKMTFSPFGYGEVCWRDYEAISLGSLLLKPRMDHLATEPNLFVANETYVPLNWNFSDLSEKVSYYLKNDGERNRIVRNAYHVSHRYFTEKQFLSHMRSILSE